MLYFKDHASFSATAQIQLFEILLPIKLSYYYYKYLLFKHFKLNCNYTEITQQSILVAFMLIKAPGYKGLRYICYSKYVKSVNTCIP